MKFETGATPALRSSWFALVTLVPLAWLLTVTFTAGIQKIWHSDPHIGFLAQADVQSKNIEMAHLAVTQAQTDAALNAAGQEMKKAIRLYANQIIDAFVAGTFLALVSVIVLLSLREWFLLVARRKPAVLRETEPVWLPDYAVAEGGRSFGGVAGTAALTLALAKELSGEAQLERAQQQAQVCQCGPADSGEKVTRATKCDRRGTQEIYVEITEQRFNGVRRCC